MMYIQINGNVLCFDNSVLEFDFPIKNYIEVNDTVILLLDTSKDKNKINNVYGVDKNYREIIWRIDDIRNYYPEHPIAFRSLSLEEGDVWVIDLIGWNYKIIADTGEIIERVFEK